MKVLNHFTDLNEASSKKAKKSMMKSCYYNKNNYNILVWPKYFDRNID